MQINKTEMVYAFVRSKTNLLDQDSPWAKAALAKLRRGIGKTPGENPEIWEITLGDLPEQLTFKGKDDNYKPTAAEWAIHTALTLYALHRQGKSASMSAAGNSLGAAARKLKSPDGNNEQSLKRRFDAVTTARDLAELAYHARGLVQLFKAAEPPVTLDYPRFAADLYRYQFTDARNQVRLRWGQDFWVIASDSAEKTENGQG